MQHNLVFYVHLPNSHTKVTVTLPCITHRSVTLFHKLIVIAVTEVSHICSLTLNTLYQNYILTTPQNIIASLLFMKVAIPNREVY